ncbi:alpha-galactosidase [Miniimonas arenae]|uniref:Alpha-galactosidase n=1 Tax=Miniimonas arenae TaxID=676201 RepID=A0A5C5BDE3_9MICO|nr:alpha-galactosidase [Miniimonas arenae]TNU76445.1 alpha-galactosidase [Miniimonas arenae]
MSKPVNAYLHLHAEGVGVVIDLAEGRLPAVLHWGADLGALTVADAQTLALTGVHVIAPNIVDEPVRVALLPEARTGWLGRPGISGSRGGRDWSPAFTTTALVIDGVDQDANGETPVLLERGTAEATVLAVDDVAGLALELRIGLTPGGLLRTRALLRNTGADAYQLDDLVLAYPVPPVARELLDLAGQWGRERSPQRRALTVGTHLREGRRGRTGADAATVLHAGTPSFSFGSGEVWGVHIAWSGNHTHLAERLSTGEQVLGGGELLLPGEVVLAPGEHYSSPWLYGSYGEGLDGVAHRFHRYLRSRPQHPDVERPVTINVWEAVYFDHRLPPLLELAEIAASLGVERFVLDDGWFGSRRDDYSGLGDWTVSADVWPDGLHPLVDRVKDLGMQFGLWFEPEMVNLDSDVARAHPDWVLATGGRMPVPSRHQQVLDLGNPDAYAYIRDAIVAMLAEYRIDYIKWDHNRDLVDAGSGPAGRPGVHAQTLAVYRLMDEIRAAHPGLEIEACASGGARVDLGILERTDRVWVSDCIDPLERQQMLRWSGQLLPPELLGSHIASGVSHTTGRSHDLDFRAATALFGHLGIEWDLRRASERERAELAEWIAFYKRERGLLLRGDLVRVDFPNASLTASGVVSPDRSRAIYSFASVATHETALLGRLRFPGLDPDRRYRVAPVLVGSAPSGLLPPQWWGVERDHSAYLADLHEGHAPRLRQVGEHLGVELPGSVLVHTGLVDARVNPDHVLLYSAEAVD